MFKVIQWAIVGLKSRLSHAVFILVSVIPKILKRKVSKHFHQHISCYSCPSITSKTFRKSGGAKTDFDRDPREKDFRLSMLTYSFASYEIAKQKG